MFLISDGKDFDTVLTSFEKVVVADDAVAGGNERISQFAPRGWMSPGYLQGHFVP